jgi:L-amino acid N-acyltransferase YncA
MDLRRATPQDFSEILKLQAANFIDNLRVEDLRDGFLSAEFTSRQLEEIANDVALLVASDKGRVLGYLCACSCDYYKQFPLLAKMIRSFDSIHYLGKPLSSYRLFIYGPVCVDKSYRGHGLLHGLYDVLLREVSGIYEVGTAFVSKDNPHSLSAHVNGLGMANTGEFEFRGRHYDILAFLVDS